MRPVRFPALLSSCMSASFAAHAPRLIPHDNFTAVIANIGGQIDHGYAENVYGYASTWPRRPSGPCTITYCYNDHVIKEQFHEYVEEAVKLWVDALGDARLRNHVTNYAAGDKYVDFQCDKLADYDE